jgi:hypothetical protein
MCPHAGIEWVAVFAGPFHAMTVRAGLAIGSIYDVDYLCPKRPLDALLRLHTPKSIDSPAPFVHGEKTFSL